MPFPPKKSKPPTMKSGEASVPKKGKAKQPQMDVDDMPLGYKGPAKKKC